MSKEYFLIGPHGDHCFVEGDDGLTHPWYMVKAAWQKGIIPAITSHNSMQGIGPYIEAMQHVGYGKVLLPGVEIGYSVTTGGFSSTDNVAERPNAQIFAGVGRGVFYKDLAKGDEINREYTPHDIEESQKFIENETVILMKEPINSLIPKLRKEIRRMQIIRFVLGDPDAASELAYFNGAGLLTALTEPGFPIFWLEYLRVVETSLADLPEMLKIKNAPPVEKIILAGNLYRRLGFSKDKKEQNKGEMICLMPANEGLVNKMGALVEHWRVSGAYKTQPLTDLFDYLMSSLNAREYASLVFNLPHPISMDSHLWGRLIVNLLEGGKALYSPEIFTAEVAAEIGPIEVLNAAHTAWANRMSARVAQNDLFKNKGRTGASDSHHPSWVGTAATLVKVDEVSTEGILEAMRNGDTLPISGLGKLSTTPFPFFIWAGTVPLKGYNFTPQIVFDWISRLSDVQTPARLALEAGLFEKKRRQENFGWVFSPDGKSVQVYP